MNRLLSHSGAFLALVSLTASLAFATPEKAKTTKSAIVKCPLCKSPLTTKKDKHHQVAVMVKGKTFYACKEGAAKLKGTAKTGSACENCPHHSKAK